jgi:hypothetical protein
MYIGSQGRFSTDLDFTGIGEHDHEDVILEMMQAFDQPFHGIQFSIQDESYYETQDGLSWGVNPTYCRHFQLSRVARYHSCESLIELRRSIPKQDRGQDWHGYNGKSRSRERKSDTEDLK